MQKKKHLLVEIRRKVKTVFYESLEKTRSGIPRGYLCLRRDSMKTKILIVDDEFLERTLIMILNINKKFKLYLIFLLNEQNLNVNYAGYISRLARNSGMKSITNHIEFNQIPHVVKYLKSHHLSLYKETILQLMETIKVTDSYRKKDIPKKELLNSIEELRCYYLVAMGRFWQYQGKKELCGA